MTDLEQQVWAATYAAMFAKDLAAIHRYGTGSIDDVDGFSCAERADAAVVKLREALSSEDAGYLIPGGWEPDDD